MALGVTVVVDDAEWDEPAEAAFRREVRRLERSLVRLRMADADLLATCRTVGDGHTLLRLELNHGKASTRVHRVVPHVVTGLSVVFDALVAALVGASAPRRADAAAVASVFPAFLWYARRETALAELEARHPAGTLDPEELAEAVVSEVLDELGRSEGPMQVLERLQGALRRRLEAAEGDLGERALTEESLDAPVAKVPISLVLEQQGEGASDAWWPEWNGPRFEERLEDVDASGTEDLVDDHEHRARLVRALFRLDPGPRRDWAEVLLDGWAVDAAAAAQGRTEDDLRHELETSRAFLARALDLPEARVDDEYRALGERYRDEARDLSR